MIRRQTITLLLIFVSLLTLAVPVMPHHHHADGNICLQHDLTALPMTPLTPGGHSHDCRNQGCVTTHYFQRVPTIRQHVCPDQILHPLTGFVSLFLKKLSAITDNSQTVYSDSSYTESLYDTFFIRVKGRRAPPVA